MKKTNKMSLIIGWLYPELMNTYGDRGNILSLKKRCTWRGIQCEIKELNSGFNEKELEEVDFIFMGGAQDSQQQIVAEDLFKKEKVLKRKINEGLPGLYICGAYQFLGKYYKNADGSVIDGLGIIDLYTQNPGLDKKRLIGNIAAKSLTTGDILVGFENHGGRTYLGNEVKPLAKVIIGFGNNGVDKTEGAVYKNSFCSYLHGPILPKNPSFADYLIKISLEKKYTKKISLLELDNCFENLARKTIARKLKIKV